MAKAKSNTDMVLGRKGVTYDMTRKAEEEGGLIHPAKFTKNEPKKTHGGGFRV